MLPLGWSIGLTVLMVVVGGYCTWAWAKNYSAGTDAANPAQITHLNHAIMSVLMLLMIWRPAGELGSWVQALIFGAFAIALIVWVRRSTMWRERVDLSSHVLMNIAMAWMLLAMPLLMGHAVGGAGGGHQNHGGAAADVPMETIPTPPWVEAVNIAMIAVCVLIAGWWAVRMRKPTARLHPLCHLLGAAGMALMLALM